MEVARLGAEGLLWQIAGPGHSVWTSVGDLDVDALHDALERTATT